MWKTAKILVLAAVVTSANGCQLLIDNRSRGSGAVVVVPSEEWDSLRQASFANSRTPVSAEVNDTETEMSAVKIEPTPGSEAITFSNYTSSNLGGCITTGIIEVHHQGAVDDAFTLLKNEAFRLNGNALILIRMNSTQAGYSSTVNVEARLLNCPLRVAKGN